MNTSYWTMLLTLALAPTLSPPAPSSTTVWVDSASGDNSNSGLSEGAAVETITVGVFKALALSGDVVVRVKPGTYDKALGESFPIEIGESDITIIGHESDPEDWPVLGGDVDSSSVEALIRIVVSTTELQDITFERLRFAGENSAGKDAPSAISVTSDLISSTGLIRSGASHCVFERSEMNASGAAGRATIFVGSSRGGCNFYVDECEIWVSRRGGIEVLSMAAEEGFGTPKILVSDCAFLISGSDDAEFGIRVGNQTGYAGKPAFSVVNTVIDSTAATTSNDGIRTGIAIELDASGVLAQVIAGSKIDSCTIKGCIEDGVRITASETNDGNANFFIHEEHFAFNRIHGNGGAGIHLDWMGESGYISFSSMNNLIFDNGTGIWFDGVNEEISGQHGSHYNDTIAHNAGFGFRFDGTDWGGGGVPAPGAMPNLIVWGNNSGNAQSGGDLSWNPQTDSALAFSCWQGLASPTNGNINSNPEFVNASGGDFHLDDAGSPCVDSGTAYSLLPRTDLDGGDRTVNGDGSGGDEIDMGVDEFDP